MPLQEFTFRLALAFALGALVGIERQYRQKSAGLRTNTLVSLGSAGFILLSLSLTDHAGDPSRVAGQIVTGIGFLGAGVIMKNGISVQGLNTAATIWCSAALGTLSGAGLYWQAVIMSIATIMVHVSLRPVIVLINRLPHPKEDLGASYYTILVRCEKELDKQLRQLVLQHIKQEKHLQLHSLKSLDEENGYVSIEASFLAKGHEGVEELAEKLILENISEVTWKINGYEGD